MNSEDKHQFDFQKSIMPHLGKTSKLMAAFLKESFAKHQVDLTKEQFVLLKVLHDEDGVMQKDLAFITERNKSSLARLMSTMEKKNLVARIPSTEDKRINRIFLTKKGRKVFERLRPVIIDGIQLAQQGLTQQEIETTIAVLHKIQHNIGSD